MGKRLSWDERHKQLIEVAMDCVREEGAEALTLAKVAERAGITKPIAYDHFKSKEGLLTELCRTFDEVQRAEMCKLLEVEDADIAFLSRQVSRSYMDCYAKTEGEWHGVYSSIRSNALTVSVHDELFDEHVAVLAAIFGPHSPLKSKQLSIACIGLMGAAETISISMTRGYTSKAEATDMLAGMFEAVLSGQSSATTGLNNEAIARSN